MYQVLIQICKGQSPMMWPHLCSTGLPKYCSSITNEYCRSVRSKYWRSIATEYCRSCSWDDRHYQLSGEPWAVQRQAGTNTTKPLLSQLCKITNTQNTHTRKKASRTHTKNSCLRNSFFPAQVHSLHCDVQKVHWWCLAGGSSQA